MKLYDNSDPSCRHFNTCSGCSLDLNIQSPPIWEDVCLFFEKRGIFPIKLYKGPPIHWRMRAKLAVRGSSENPLIGLFKAGSHDVIPIPACQIHHPNINRAVDYIKSLIQLHGLMPYNEQTGQGELRYLQFVVQRATGKVQAALVLNIKDRSNKAFQKWENILKSISEEDQNRFWHSIWVNFNDRSTNTIFGPEWNLIFGEELLWERFGHASICYQPASFAQANLDLFEKMLQRIEKLILPNAKLAEFYAGVGVIGLFLAPQCLWVRCAEVNPHAEFCFLRSRSELPSSTAEKVSFHTGPASKLLSILEGADVAVVDPPRKGLDLILLKALNQSPQLKQLIYVSCGWEAFKRDCDDLLKAGWRIAHAEGYWFFPGSNHMEILSVFKKDPIA